MTPLPTAELTFDQRQQIVEWFAAGQTPQNIIDLIGLQNSQGGSLAPWPYLTKEGLGAIRAEVRQLIARETSLRMDNAFSRGLGRREQQASFMIERLQEHEVLGSALQAQILKLISEGALNFDLAVLGEPIEDPDIIDGEVVGHSAKVPSISNPVLRLNETRVAVQKELFKRTMEMTKLATIIGANQARMMEVLGRITATIDQDSHIDIGVQRQKAEELAEMLRKRAEKAGIDLDQMTTDDHDGD